MRELDKEEEESRRWLVSTDGRTRESEARPQAGLPETPPPTTTTNCSHSLGNT